MAATRGLRRFVPSRRRAIVALSLYTIFALLMTFGGCADRLILFPSTQPIPLRDVTRVEVRRPGAPIFEVWTARSQGVTTSAGGGEPGAYCLEFVGNASRGEQMAAYTAYEWGDRPVEVWGVNYPGYGGSPGPARLVKIPPAALAAYDELAVRAGGKPIFLIGQSLGSAAALYVAANRPCAGVILTNPPPLRNMILSRFGWWNLWVLAGPVAMAVPGELDSIDNARRSTAPAIFILAGSDSVVPPKYQAKVFDAYAGEKRAIRVPGADHNDPLDGADARAFEAALDWMWGITRQQPAARQAGE
jgi:pimeloyl-ACP methyl ester carboxylesterase